MSEDAPGWLAPALLALGLAVLGAIAWHWHARDNPPPAAPAETVASAGAQDRESAHFTLCGRGAWENCIVDGDTIHYRHVKIRVADINAPEISSPDCDYELALGERARDRLLALLNAGRFSLVPLPDRDTDKYHRKLRTIMRGGHSLGEVLVTEGLAERWIGFRRDWCDGT